MSSANNTSTFTNMVRTMIEANKGLAEGFSESLDQSEGMSFQMPRISVVALCSLLESNASLLNNLLGENVMLVNELERLVKRVEGGAD